MPSSSSNQNENFGAKQVNDRSKSPYVKPFNGKCNRCGEFGHRSDHCTKPRATRDNRENWGRVGYANHDYDQEPLYEEQQFDEDDSDLVDAEVALGRGTS